MFGVMKFKMQKLNILFAVGILFITIGLIGIGFISNELYHDSQLKRGVYAQGLYLTYEPNWTSAMATAKEYDPSGDWIAINLNGLTFEESKRVVEHELAHEIFARYCAKKDNIDKCMNLTKS